ncbi:hypothetical protein [Nitrosovibrio sp. Nv17]|uniref:hypothetical protein n=1 Tax=Nitrosovibrio sp. Nv17 TaxID=1855339 RepID=UPI000908913E|nr:hypothetical protein [Nitrosovibrio sp. Nv17]SFW19111.1 hypothetical protein SAMN05216414_1056 [Nitrosovibrio sp. Nv17]
MPSYPNPYAYTNANIGAGLKSIADGIFNAGMMNARARIDDHTMARMQANQQSLDAVRDAQIGKLESETDLNRQRHAMRSPEALDRYAQDASGLPAQIYQGIKALRPQDFDADLGPSPAMRYSDDQMSAAQIGGLLSQHFGASKEPNPQVFAQAQRILQGNAQLPCILAGDVSADEIGDALFAIAGKPRYGMSDGIQYSTNRLGTTHTTPLGTAKIGERQAAADKHKADEVRAIAAALFDDEKRKVGPFAPKSDQQNSGRKFYSLSSGEREYLDTELEAAAGTKLENIDSNARIGILSRATDLSVNPDSEFYRNPVAALQAAIAEMAPAGFEDSAGMFSSARFTPKKAPGAVPARPATAGGGLPPEARTRLKEGVVTRFANGQAWTLQSGQPVQVQ